MSQSQQLIACALPLLNEFIRSRELNTTRGSTGPRSYEMISVAPTPGSLVSLESNIRFLAAWFSLPEGEELTQLVSTGWLQRPWPRMEWEVASRGPGYVMSCAAHVQLLRTVLLIRLLLALLFEKHSTMFGWNRPEVEALIKQIKQWERDGDDAPTQATKRDTAETSGGGESRLELVQVLEASGRQAMEIKSASSMLGKVELNVLLGADVGAFGQS
ncbi:hypothetical protein BWQ96_07119 [Gracilariopsis chorda]|uniref:Uncharacterized protein n=1 Tax=Gracilariopsis chorda TaxID=448386 RepID=A0A2V3IM70_9FLOR|nr:hypothetical protein BWQ96_07119 [Gracilariopsis chorda]|eukprot:PXF43175.1 hypothetical protein BWQ96_07119 [Gracilariopsis chorda]